MFENILKKKHRKDEEIQEDISRNWWIAGARTERAKSDLFP
jgi:hypothetical protein